MSETNSPRFAVIVAAAGKSSRFQDDSNSEEIAKKPFVQLSGKPVWLHSVEKFLAREDVRQVIVVVSPDDLLWFRRFYATEINRLLLIVIGGGKERSDSVQKALSVIGSDIDFIAVHDAARPCTTNKQIDAVFQKARENGAALLAAPIVGTIKRVRDDVIEETVSRDNLWEAQTPQVFRRDLLLEAYDRRDNKVSTDDAQLLEYIGCPVHIVPAERSNLKITTRADLTIAEIILSGENGNKKRTLQENVNYDSLEG